MRIIIHIEDLLITCKEETKNKNKNNKMIDILNLKGYFEIKNLGEVKHYLGIKIKRYIGGNFEKNEKC